MIIGIMLAHYAERYLGTRRELREADEEGDS